jgi:hypothetical protein
MTTLSDLIVYIWLLPVAAQIILPLCMFLVWLISKPLFQQFSRKSESPVLGQLAPEAEKAA